MISSTQCLQGLPLYYTKTIGLGVITNNQYPISIILVRSDDLVDLGVDYLTAYPALVVTGLCVAVLLLLALAFICREGEEHRQDQDQEEEVEEEEKIEKKESKKDT